MKRMGRIDTDVGVTGINSLNVLLAVLISQKNLVDLTGYFHRRIKTHERGSDETNKKKNM
jgi:hypothetical protein